MNQPHTQPSRAWNATLWTAQLLLGLTFAATGVWKLVTPLSTLRTILPWTGEVAPSFFYMTAIFDLLGGVGVILPTLTRVAPWLASLAALGCAALQACAVVFHISRGEAANTPFNFLLIAVALFVAWGRRKNVPVV
jgi:uncharacterized membrane protein YphA (DoxX/SURF4 family)